MAAGLAQHLLVNSGSESETDLLGLPPELQHYVEHVSAAPDSRGTGAWECVMAAMVDTKPETLRAIVDHKEARCCTHRGHAREIWLVVHSSAWPRVGSGCRGVATTGGMTPAIRRATFYSSFDRVFLYDQAAETVEELSVRPAR